MKKTYTLILSLGCLAAVSIFLLGNGAFIGAKQSQNDINVEFGIWTSGTTFEQTFAAVHDNLFRIDFWVDSYRPWDSPYLECRLFELDITQAPWNLTYDVIRTHRREVRATTVNGWRISPHAFNTCRFDPIPDSAGKYYLLSLQSPELRQGGASILRGSYRKRLETEAFFVNGEKQEKNDLAFRVLYTRLRWALFKESIDKLTLRKPFPFSQPVVLYLLFGLYLVLIFLLVLCFSAILRRIP